MCSKISSAALLLGLLLTGYGAYVTAKSVIITDNQAKQLGTTMWGNNPDFVASLHAQSQAAQRGLYWIASEIIRMLNSAFNAFTNVRTDYYPAPLRGEIDAVNDLIYRNINNGVYRAGFATAQEAYEEAARSIFPTFDEIETRLSRQRYLVGRQITEADWRLFRTLVRFDAVYYSHFKCNLRRVADYPNLWNYTRELYQVPGVAETVSIDQIKRHYYGSQRQVNPTGIVPIDPLINFTAQHDRGRFG